MKTPVDWGERVEIEASSCCSECGATGVAVCKLDNGEGAWAYFCAACLREALREMDPLTPLAMNRPECPPR